MTSRAKDLTKEAPASPHQRVGGYVILARLADKGRAQFMGGNIGEYHTDCPLDRMLLDWKGLPYADIKKEFLAGAENEALAKFLDTHGTPKTPDEVRAWSDSMDQLNPYYAPDKKGLVRRGDGQARSRCGHDAVVRLARLRRQGELQELSAR